MAKNEENEETIEMEVDEYDAVLFGLEEPWVPPVKHDPGVDAAAAERALADAQYDANAEAYVRRQRALQARAIYRMTQIVANLEEDTAFEVIQMLGVIAKDPEEEREREREDRRNEILHGFLTGVISIVDRYQRDQRRPVVVHITRKQWETAKWIREAVGDERAAELFETFGLGKIFDITKRAPPPPEPETAPSQD